ncbi:Myb-like DNA-binding domain containing protein [Histomonas meleagridis]|uniref:Myb-like DNA-binding domain containing protein n=1 Tax=Histomonas meleagridis TaxID=135588 RepID=UPI003559BD10|nr:Myb-like DNA-binding domain containing protein [Histomonas meleagridis]KAH0798833.1 Myb-like DNA-binding domain containing protein [Histomonas meleagridis]
MTCGSPESREIPPQCNMNNKSAINSPISINPPPKVFKKSKWTPEEDRLLRESIHQNGMSNWSLVAQLIPGRSGKQCRERWINQLCPNLNKDNWSPNEDAILIQQQRLYGNVWSKIAQFLPGRSSNNVKNRWSWLSRHRISQQIPTQMMQYVPQQMPYGAPRNAATPDLFNPQQTAPPDLTWNIASDGPQFPQMQNRYAFSEPNPMTSDMLNSSSMISTESDTMMLNDDLNFGMPRDSERYDTGEMFEAFDWS